ncbi:hypothetical protein [Falsirhodobacter xinxiangensis]|uniref:hypothetical protein n=1 Tax=Falsirhodobacter xinxiangensis TaxID=2530049 RepID=UPI0010AB4840|nr:hypothetical protein [Rhodobacter xinxiangensis]
MQDLDHKAALAWAMSRSTGLSASAIVCRAFGLPCDGSYPHDGGDFGRCERAMDMIPGLRERLPQMAEVNSYWAALVPEWDTIKAAEDKFRVIQSIIRPKEDKDPAVVRMGAASLRFGRPK